MSIKSTVCGMATGVAFGFAIIVGTSGPASAVLFTFDVSDHPDGNQNPPFEYGLRLDAESKFFSFDGASTAQLSVDTGAVTASLLGTVIENSLGNNFVATWILDYVLSGVALVGASGEFTATGGSGTVTEIGGAMQIINLVGKQDGSGDAFLFLNDGHRLPAITGLVGRGWIDKPGTNDFLFTATIGQPAVIPLPASLPLFGTGLAVMGFLGWRRKRKAAA